jgi:hypothetical protein
MEPRFAMRPEPTMLQRMSERAWLLIVRRDVDLIEIASGVLMLGWGLQLLMPWNTFTTSASYAAMGAIMPEFAWGAMLAWVGLTQVGAYLLDQWRIRLASTLGSCMAWTFLGVLFGVANPQGTGIVVYPFLALVSALVFWRILTHRIDR